MSSVRFLWDENVPLELADYLASQEPSIEILVPGQNKEAPPKGTSDPDVLRFAKAERLALVTLDKSTMPVHVGNHFSAGGHTWGLFILRPGYPLKRYANDLILVWSASESENWQDRIEYLPW
jgi:hypothetical protein